MTETIISVPRIVHMRYSPFTSLRGECTRLLVRSPQPSLVLPRLSFRCPKLLHPGRIERIHRVSVPVALPKFATEAHALQGWEEAAPSDVKINKYSCNTGPFPVRSQLLEPALVRKDDRVGGNRPSVKSRPTRER